ncbi:MAG: glutamine--fructose-6-phosphate transaminase (isomerizing) [Desulfobacterales bacterium]|nr:glutamine--fructose-6-phosphate transaminase (isomerizing) [Desulfobacterales bacterium]
MCGIVGYVGERNAAPILMEGLKRLEYRGYDSAGLGVVNKKKLHLHKKEGKLSRLAESLPAKIPGKTGIAHTRWATHGGVNDANAHPQAACSGKIAVVHNGIIDNYVQLKNMLLKEGHTFTSETDTEVVAHLVEKHMNGDLEEAVKKALSQIEGTYGLIVLFSDFPDRLVGARNGSPLVVGVGEKEMFVASDVNAIMAHTKQVFYIEDRETVLLKKDFHRTTDTQNFVVDKKIQEIEWDLEEAEKGKFEHFMLKEIFEQPESIERSYGGGGRLLPDFGTAKLGGLNIEKKEFFDIKRISIVGMGTAYYASMVGAYLLENFARIPATAEMASELRYRNAIVQKETLYFAVSQSGETADTLIAMREIQNRGGRVLGICNSVGSTIARESDGGVYIHAGPEIAVASTKAFTSQVTTFMLLALMIGRMRDIPLSAGKRFIKELLDIPEKARSILRNCSEIEKIARKYKDCANILFLARGINYPIALEGALKLKEISYIHAEGFSAGDIKHGPIALVNEEIPSLFLAIKGETFEKILGNIEEIKARGGRTIVVANCDDDRLRELSDDLITIPETDEFFSPLLTIVPLQLFAYYIAAALKRDVDQPRNLAKTVTVE